MAKSGSAQSRLCLSPANTASHCHSEPPAISRRKDAQHQQGGRLPVGLMPRTSSPTMVIIRYHGDAQTPNVRLHTVALLVELRVYPFRLEKETEKDRGDILSSVKSRGLRAASVAKGVV